MFVLFPRLSRVDVCMEHLGLEGVVNINASPWCEAESIMTGCPLSFLLVGIDSSKQTILVTNYYYWTLKRFQTLTLITFHSVPDLCAIPTTYVKENKIGIWVCTVPKFKNKNLSTIPGYWNQSIHLEVDNQTIYFTKGEFFGAISNLKNKKYLMF